MKKIATLLILIAALMPASLLWAQDYDKKLAVESQRLSLGAAVLVTPEFEGSDEYKFSAVPVIEYSNQYFFISGENGFGLKALRLPNLTMGPLAKYRFGRDQDDSDLLEGLGDVRGGLELGGFIDWKIIERVNTKLEVLHGVGNAKGYTADLSLNYSQSIADNLFWVVGASTQFSSSKYNQDYFGITEEQSRRSGYAAYDPGSGIKHGAVHTAFSYSVNDSVQLSVFGQYKRLTGPASDSPLVERGSANQFSTGMSLTWLPFN